MNGAMPRRNPPHRWADDMSRGNGEPDRAAKAGLALAATFVLLASYTATATATATAAPSRYAIDSAHTCPSFKAAA